MTFTAGVTSGSTPFEAFSNTVPVSFATRPTTGQTLIVWFWGWANTGNPSAPSATDNQAGVTNAYTLLASKVDTVNHTIVGLLACYGLGTTSGTFTVTPTFTAPGGGGIVAGAKSFTSAGSVIVDASGTNIGTSTGPSVSTGGATIQASELAVAAFMLGTGTGTFTITSPSGWTVDVQEPSAATYSVGEGDSKVLAATGTQTATWGIGTSQAWIAAIATLKDAGGATDPFPAGYFQHPRQYLRV